MELSNPFRMIPTSYYLPIAVIAGGLVAWRFLFSGDSGDVDAPQSDAMGYDPSLVALGVQTSLERDKLAASTELGRLSIATEMHALDVQSEMQSREIGLADTINNRAENNATNLILSQERMYGADIGLKHAELGVMGGLGLAEQETARIVSANEITKAQIMGNASVAAAKAAKKKSIGFGGFSLSL